jgi:hypothetical protein
MKCAYPNCYHAAAFTPYLELPTMRSVGESQAMVQTDKPTLLLCQEVCSYHKEHYNLRDWVSLGDWDAIRELAFERGYAIPEIAVMVVHFGPCPMTPKRYLELERK